VLRHAVFQCHFCQAGFFFSPVLEIGDIVYLPSDHRDGSPLFLESLESPIIISRLIHFRCRQHPLLGSIDRKSGG